MASQGTLTRVRLPIVTLPASSQLWHGSDCAGRFSVPDGPAWFALDEQTGVRWASWRETPPAGRRKGKPRLFSFLLSREVELLDVEDISVWQEFGLTLLGDPEASPWALAQALVGQADGWRTEAEIMLCCPRQHLQPLEAPRLLR